MGQFKNIALVGKYPSLEDAKHIHDQLNVLVDYLKKIIIRSLLNLKRSNKQN